MGDSESRERSRHPLAFDANGNPIRVPHGAASWRVKRGGGRRGRPRSMFRDGHQLEIPIGASIEELIQAECPTDRYLLYPVDDQGLIIPGVVAVTEVPPGYEEDGGGEGDEGEPGEELVARLLTALERQSETLCKAVEHTTRGYDPVTAPAAPREVLVRQPPVETAPSSNAGDEKSKIELVQQIMAMAAQVYGMFQQSRNSAGGGDSDPPEPPVSAPNPAGGGGA
jgi:hypothetical protein